MQKKRTLMASIWVIGGFLAALLIRLGGNLILTRLLSPKIFGIMAIVTAINVGVTLCSNIGLKQNIIRHKKGLEPDYLNTAWTLQIFRGGIMWLLLALIGYGIQIGAGNFDHSKNTAFSYPELPSILLVTGFTAFLTGLSSTKIWVAQRNLQLKRQTILDLCTQLLGICVMVGWAYYYKTIWGLVIGGVVSTLFNSFLSHFVNKGAHNRFYFDKAIAKDFFHFGKWLFLSAIITFFALHGDRFILGNYLSADKLGVYATAYFIADSVNTILGRLSDNVFFPVLSEAWRNSKDTLKQKYYRLRLVQDTLVLLVAGFLYATAPLIIAILYDDRYQDAGWMLRILSISLIGSNYLLGSKLLTVMGHPYVRTVIVTARALLLWTSVPIALNLYGIEGGLYAISGNVGIEIIVIIIALYKYKILSLFREFMLLPVVVIGYGLGELFIRFYQYMITVDFNYIIEIINNIRNTL